MSLSAGTRVGVYEILAALGSGGMGEVYLAKDVKLEREVAFKVLPASVASNPEYLLRFEEEARLASVLNHPNIVTIYGVGEESGLAYIAMEFVRGRTLREQMAGAALPLNTALEVAVQVADALAAAHAGGIVHRDLKPENLMITPEGLVKVLDFGIAKRSIAATPTQMSDVATQAVMTEVGTILGTVGYMSPEQIVGKPVDGTADQFSFGAILYEMLCGRRAFERGTSIATLAAIIHDHPEPIQNVNAQIAGPLREIVTRCLAKDPKDRYPDTRELAAALRRTRGGQGTFPIRLTRRQAVWLGVATTAAAGLVSWRLWPPTPQAVGVRSLAVLPFVNAQGDSDTEYLCDGITESLIRQISQLPSVTVKARSAVFNFKGKAVDPRDAGRQLGVGAVVTGTVARRAGRLRITAELVEVKTGASLWSNTYDRAAADLLSIQDEIAIAIINDGIRVPASSDERGRVTRRPTNDPEAYELYVRAVSHFMRGDEEGYLTAREFLRKAIARDKNFADAHARLGGTYAAMAVDGFERPTQAWPESHRHVRQALLIEPDLRLAHAIAATEAFYFNWNWAETEREWELAMRPGGEVVPGFLASRADTEWALGHLGSALQLARKAREMDPLSPSVALKEADLMLQGGQLDAASRVYEQVIRDNPGSQPAYLGLAEVKRAQAQFDEAIDAWRRAFASEGDSPFTKLLRRAAGAQGYREIEKAAARLELEALRARDGVAYASPLDFARASARLGETERVFAYFQAAFDDRAPGLTYLKVDRAWDSVRADPRFLIAVARVGLPQGS